ncbi:uridylate-specific endoribonuclease-like, partial [Rhincodon typus]|uniref:uridylate-specific endoribonuclease-like n=1 Tax=Rhincodon typus TaxID=259920 RepID=UPI00202F67D1
MASKTNVLLYIFVMTFTYADSYGYGSCQYNCGGHTSDCSCDYNCWYNGNCCSDFCDQCPYMGNGYCHSNSATDFITTAATTTAVISDIVSCRDNCGAYVFVCSCESDCSYYGNCCPDFCDQCAYMNS